ncbi:MAG: CRISPR-associated endonuclease Cas2 [Eubacteriales bacterium]|nr:CRISPR-associated endonuclease Cas2 [Eubacteriales bacterium]
MLIVIAYDVNTCDAGGQRRLRQVAKHCRDYGQRVQNSVFECLLDAAQWIKFRRELEALIDPAKDSLRYYQLGDHYQTRIQHYGCDHSYDPNGTLMI